MAPWSPLLEARSSDPSRTGTERARSAGDGTVGPPAGTGAASDARGPFCSRHYAPLAAAVLGLAAFNLLFHLGSEALALWDEALYATTAGEMVKSGNWIGTTFLGTLDYYNTKPPLNVWLIALSFKAFGTGLISLRLPSVISAWLTVAVLQWWTRRSFGSGVALAASLVLATTFGFLHVHAGRSANTDALFTLLILLTVVTLWASRQKPWHRVWLGPLAAAVFLLRGMAVIMPLGIVLAVEVLTRRQPSKRWSTGGIALLLFLAPVAAWAVARWQVDEWQFFERLLAYDFVARSVTVIEKHPGTLLYYVNILHKNHYDWLLAGAVSLVFMAFRPRRLRSLFSNRDDLAVLVASWAGVTLLIPTLMLTKLPWYLNPFYPVFALGIGWVVAHGFSHVAHAGCAWRRAVLASVVVVALGVAEGKLLWYSFHYRDLRHSPQGLLLAERKQLAGSRVFRAQWDWAELFVIGQLVRAEHGLAANPDDFWRQSRPGDYLVSPRRVEHSHLMLMRSWERDRLYRRRE